MALEIKQSLKLSQQLVMTPQLQQAIKLLQLTRIELQEVVNQEMMENPTLEEATEVANSDSTQGEGIDLAQDPEAEQKRDEDLYSKPDARETAVKDDFNWEAYLEEFSSSPSPSAPSKEINEDLPSFENILTKTTSLEDHLMWQLSMVELADNEKHLGKGIIGNLSEAGYLTTDLEGLAREAKIELEDAEEVLKIVQSFDPVGVGSRTVEECLLTQAKILKPRQPLVEKIIAEHLNDLQKKNYQFIARTLSEPLEKIIEATRVILEFEPKPGRSFNSADTHYITPDIYVYKVGNEFTIVLNEDGMPKLRISPYYRSILSSGKKEQNKVTREYVQEKVRSAVWLIRSIHNRQKTIYKVTEAIVARQRDFFEKGVQWLKPMILKDVANDIGMHESTVSRVTTNKYVHTPVGIFELKYFFNSSINSTTGELSLASEAVKEKIRQLISKENPRSPLSDQKIVELLKKEEIDIARRTVAKYRDMLNILSSGKRKKLI